MSESEAVTKGPTVKIDEHLIERGAEALRPLTTDIEPVRRTLTTTVLSAVLPEYRAQVIRECAEAVRRHADEREQRGGDGRLHAEGCDIAADLLDRMAEGDANE